MHSFPLLAASLLFWFGRNMRKMSRRAKSYIFLTFLPEKGAVSAGSEFKNRAGVSLREGKGGWGRVGGLLCHGNVTSVFEMVHFFSPRDFPWAAYGQGSGRVDVPDRNSRDPSRVVPATNAGILQMTLAGAGQCRRSSTGLLRARRSLEWEHRLTGSRFRRKGVERDAWRSVER